MSTSRIINLARISYLIMALRLSRQMWTLVLATDVENNIDVMCHTGILHCVAKVDSLYIMSHVEPLSFQS